MSSFLGKFLETFPEFEQRLPQTTSLFVLPAMIVTGKPAPTGISRIPPRSVFIEIAFGTTRRAETYGRLLLWSGQRRPGLIRTNIGVEIGIIAQNVLAQRCRPGLGISGGKLDVLTRIRS